ncbi:MAG: DNA polymerase III subunit delta' [Bacteroidales bacterium]
MLFKEIIGQERIKNQLIKTVKDSRIAHAQLFIGPEGSGKLALALAYAQYINCENRGDSDACGTCASCRKYKKFTHPDLHFVFPVKKSSETNPEDSDHYINLWRETIMENSYINPRIWYQKLDLENKQGIIPTSESNRVINKLYFKSFEAEYKIMIIWLPERMHQSAANKLLKLIEEPPPKTVFLMITENPDLLLPTILSRTQKIRVPKIDDESLFNAISDHFGLEPNKAREVVRLSNGNYIEALHFIHTREEEKENFQRFVSLMRLCYGRKVVETLDWVEQNASLGRENLKTFLQYAARMIRENFMMNLNMENIVYFTEEEKTFSRNFSSFVHTNNANRIYNQFNKAYRDIQMNAHIKTILLDLSIQLMKLLRL